MAGSDRRFVVGWATAMAAFIAGGIWMVAAEYTPHPPPPPPMRARPGAPAPEPYRRLEPSEIEIPDPSVKHDVLFNNNQF